MVGSAELSRIEGGGGDAFIALAGVRLGGALGWNGTPMGHR